MSARLRLTLSYVAFLMVCGTLLLGVVWVFLLRYVPENVGAVPGFVPDRTDLVRAFVPPAALALLALLVVAVIGGWLLAGRMLAPLRRIGDAARRASEGSLAHRIHLEGPRDEFRDLADGFDTMLERLEAHVAEQQRFAANASHELRTPLAISQTLLDVARQDSERDVDVLIDRLSTVNARATGLIEALLLLSRAERRVADDEQVDLSLLVEEVTETLLPAAERRGVTLLTSGDPAWTVGSPDLLLHLVSNLAQNAIVHNLPSGGTVSVRTASRDGASELVVENSGAALTPELVATLSEPFQRGSERVRAASDDHPGAGLGLGLAIVKSIVAAHDGTLTLAPRPEGGLVVTVWLRGRRSA